MRQQILSDILKQVSEINKNQILKEKSLQTKSIYVSQTISTLMKKTLRSGISKYGGKNMLSSTS